MNVETVRVSEKGKSQLLSLKKKTGIQNWNVLCRWALLLSLAETTVPPQEDIHADSSVEMSWKTFAGPLDDAIRAAILERAHRDGIRTDDIPNFFKLHLHRGIAYLNNSVKDLGSMLALASK